MLMLTHNQVQEVLPDSCGSRPEPPRSLLQELDDGEKATRVLGLLLPELGWP